MSFWVLLQILVNLVFVAGLVGAWIRLGRPQKDDPRLSKGLQLLQSKIAVLEDLSDRTETQVNQLTALLEQKVKDIQFKIQAADKQIAKIEHSMQKSLEVAKIFQDKIPHTEIIERQNTVKYVKAARLAHQGHSVEEILQEVDLSRGEIEFIAKVNKEQLMFCEDSLPEWANDEALLNAERSSNLDDVDQMTFMNPLHKDNNQEMPSAVEMSSVFEVPKTDQEALKKLGDAFKAACREVEQEAAQSQKVAQNVSTIFSVTQNIAQNFLGEKPTPATPTATTNVVKKPVKYLGEPDIRPVQFPKIELVKNLD